MVFLRRHKKDMGTIPEILDDMEKEGQLPSDAYRSRRKPLPQYNHRVSYIANTIMMISFGFAAFIGFFFLFTGIMFLLTGNRIILNNDTSMTIYAFILSAFGFGYCIWYIFYYCKYYK